jgi:hypothetical protein
MKKPYALPVIRALPAIATPEPRVSSAGLLVAKLLGGAYVRGSVGAARLTLDDSGRLIGAFERALSGRTRCILAFRHHNGWEPQALMWYVMTRLAGAAHKTGVAFARPPHLLFVHGYEVLRWGGLAARFLLPRIGAMPVHHVKLDSCGLDRIYRSLEAGPYPLGIAPEGQVSYTAAEAPRIEPGAMRIGLTVAKRLMRAYGSRSPAMEILPVSLYPVYGRRRWSDAARLTMQVESLCGLGNLRAPGAGASAGDGASDLRGRFLRCREAILAANERRYALEAPEPSPRRGAGDFAGRLDAVIEAALVRAENILCTPHPAAPADTVNRIYAVRQHCWDRIFPEDLDIAALSPLERGICDLRAGEAWHAARHMELADFAWYFHKMPPEAPTLAQAVEYAQNLYDFANRTMGGAFSARRIIAPAEVRITAAEPVNLTAMLCCGGAGDSSRAIIAQANGLLRQRLIELAP